MKKFPLLIGGCPRSGTTALLQVLNSCPEVFISSEENILALADTLQKTLGTRERREKSLHGGMRDLSLRETLTPENIRSHNFTRQSIWPTIAYIYKWHHRRMHDGRDLVLWGDKFPNYFRNLESIRSRPNVLYIHITRDPLDVVNSMLRRSEMARQGRDWWTSPSGLDEMIEAWVAAYRAILALEEAPHVLHLHYEALVFDFEQTVMRMNHFFGLDLAYENILVTDVARHFDRRYVSEEIAARLASHPAIVQYRQAVARFPWAQAAAAR